MRKTFTILLLIAGTVALRAQDIGALNKLADDFWAWRAKYAPFNGDDVPRMERPGGMRDWSRASIDRRRKDLAEFEARWKNIDASKWPIREQVDYRLIGSALSRVHWELDVNPSWRRDPTFYISQTLTALVEALTVPAPYDETRSREILTRIDNMPSILERGMQNLEKPPAPFARVAVQALENIRPHLHQMASALANPPKDGLAVARSTTLKDQDLYAATDRAADALETYRDHLQK